jgi:death-on-curing protein
MIEDWQWISKDEVVAIHRKQIERYGGLSGIRDEGLLESAIARPRNLFAYENVDNPIALAAAYAFGLARNHPFADGNKRSAFVVSVLFLDLCGLAVETSQKNVIDTVLALASGDLTEEEFADWLRGVTVPKE